MKKLLVIAVLLLVSCQTLADSIKCYSAGKVVYYRNIKDVTFTGDLFVFEELVSGRIVMFSGDCIVKIDV
jgi:hypothetical protein